jgi:hypothetical protein
MSWTTPGLLFLLLCGNFIQESFVYFLCLFNLALFFFVPFSFFLLTMLRSEMPGLRKPSGERGVAPVADEFVDGAPLHMAGLPGRLPDFFLLAWHLSCRTTLIDDEQNHDHLHFFQFL